MHGRFTWYELYTTDMAAAAKFYPPITGWGIQDWDQASADNPYRMWTSGGEPFAGLMALTPDMKSRGAPPHWLVYVDVTSAAETMAKAKSLGADVVWSETVPTVGILAVIKDPQGAIFAILQSENPSDGYDGTPKLGKPSWHELMTTDYRAAAAFYGSLFGWNKISESDVGAGITYYEFATHSGKKSVGGMFNRPSPTIPPHWLVYTHVRDANTSAGAITRGGGKIMMGPMEVPGGTWIVSFTDPQGVAHAVHSAAAASAAPTMKEKPAKAKTTKKKKSKPKKAEKKEKKKDKKKAKKEKKKAKKAAKKAKKAAKKAKKKKR